MEKEEIRKEFGAFIKGKRENLNLTQPQLAEMIGVETSTVAHYETGRRVASLPVIMKLIKALNFEFEEFTRTLDKIDEDR